MSNETVTTVKDVAGVIPVVGGVLSAVAGVAGSLGLKGKTSHLSWGEADNLAQPFSEQTTNALQTKFSLNDETTKRLWLSYQTRMTAFITSDEQGSTWWTDETRKSYWQWFTYDIEQATQRESLRHCFWLQAHWIYENVDGTKIDTEGADKMTYVANRVLLPALQDAALISNTNEVVVTKEGKLPATQTTTSTTGLQLNTANLGDTKTLLIVGGVLLVIAIIYKTSKGG
jgi:hypothetical protein